MSCIYRIFKDTNFIKNVVLIQHSATVALRSYVLYSVCPLLGTPLSQGMVLGSDGKFHEFLA